MKKRYIFALSAISASLPAFAYAQSGRISMLISYANNIVNALIIMVGAIALLVFFWGLAKFIFKVGGDEKSVEGGRRLMIWGIVALFVMVSVWGLVRFIQGELLTGLDTSTPALPGFGN